MSIQTIAWVRGQVKLIDQRLLPNRFSYVWCRDPKSLWKAIKSLQVRGAPAIGIAAALGVVLGMQNSRAKTYREFRRDLFRVTNYIGSSRPTAANLFWALERMKKVTRENRDKDVPTLKKLLLAEALKIIVEDKEICRKIGAFGARLVRNKDRVLTHCNPGALATADYGTALGVIYRAREEGKQIKVYVGETRPLLQGARLTTWELMRNGIEVTLICDNMVADVMSRGLINKVIVGADRIASNGDVANKIGTYSIALLARAHNIPFYVAAPTSTIDLSLKTGEEIPIEERGKEEIIEGFGRAIAPRKVKVYSPAFDVTPARLIAAIITEKGILRPPYKKTLAKLK